MPYSESDMFRNQNFRYAYDTQSHGFLFSKENWIWTVALQSLQIWYGNLEIHIHTHLDMIVNEKKNWSGEIKYERFELDELIFYGIFGI